MCHKAHILLLFTPISRMKHLNPIALVILGITVFCVSETHLEMAYVIQNYWTGLCVTLMLSLFLVSHYLRHPIPFPQNKILKTFCLIGFLEVLYATVQLFGFLPNNYQYACFSGSLNNPAIFGMLLSFCIPISIFFYQKTAGKEKYIWQSLNVIFTVFIILSNSRTAFIAACCGTFLILFMINHESFTLILKKKKTTVIVVVCTIITLVALYFYKQDSADGRFLIWNVCIDMIKEKPLFGWGIDGFAAQYMNYQAEYFNSHPESSLTLLADETKNPFNEFIHISLLFGIPCALLFLGIIIWSMWYIHHTRMEYSPVLLSIVFVLFVWCMFSYPLDIPFVWLIILFIVLSIITIKKDKTYTPSSKFYCTFVLFMSAFTLYLLARNGIRDIRRVYLQEHAISSSKDQNQIFEEYETMYNEFSNDGLFLYNYAAMLHLYGFHEKSIKIFDECSTYINDYNMMLLMGDNYQQMSIPDSAIIYYERASDMIPNRFLPLYYQMVVYQEQGDYDKAQEIAKTIIHKKNKIKDSKTVKEIIKRANECLNHQ